MPIDLQKFGNQVQNLRNMRGMTQEQLAEAADLSPHYIGNIEQGVRAPSLSTLFRICSALGTTPDVLFGDSISDEMRRGISIAVSKSNSLRETSNMLSSLLGDLLPLEDDDDFTLFGVPLSDIPEIHDAPKAASLSDELLYLHAILDSKKPD